MSRTCCALALLALLALLAPAHAEDRAPKPAPTGEADPAPADPDARATAERFFRAGEKAYKAQKFGAAARHFEEAYKALPLPEIAFSAAQAYRRHYRTDAQLMYAKRAVDLYQVYLDQVKSGGRVGVAADSLGEMQREVDKLTAAGARVAPVVVAERRTALALNPMLGNESPGTMSEVGDLAEGTATKIVATVDGKPVPLYDPVDVEPGPHVVRIVADGYVPYEATHRVLKGQDDVLEVKLVPRAGRIKLRTERGAIVRVDGRLLATSPEVPFEVPAGKHLITIARRGRVTVAREIDVARGQELAVAAPLRKTARRRAVPYVMVTAGVLGVITISTAAYAMSEHSKADDLLAAIEAGNQRPDAADRYDALIRRRDEAVAGSLVTGSLTVLAAGTALALFWFDRPSDDSLQLAPSVGAGGAGVTLGGRF